MTYENLLKSNPRAELARRNLLDFVVYNKPDYQVNWHHKLLCEYLDRFVRGEITRLMVFMPPQHGKSELVSRQLPAFILGRQPKTKIVLASYSSDLASSFNRDCQRIIDGEAYRDVFPDTKLNSSNVVTVAKGNWLRNSDIFEVVGYGGFLKTTGVGGSLTGTPADIAIIDDPVKDSIEAMSPTFQFRNWNWYNDVLYTRIHNGSRILITQTRWDVNDLSGKLLESMQAGGEQWTILCLPAIKVDDNPNDPRQKGEALWESRHSINKLMQVRSQSIRTFESLYQQDPKPTQVGGEFYKAFNVNRNTTEAAYNPELPLHLTFDFNVNPYMTCCVWQIQNKKAVQIAEVCTSSPNNTTKGVCNAFKAKYPKHNAGMFIYGDPSGMKEDTRSEKGYNDYFIILKELQEYKPSIRVQKQAPPVVMRANFINTIFENGYNGIEITIDKNCHKTINDYSYLKEDSDGTKLKEKQKDPSTGVTSEKYGHTSDANDYFICTAFAADFAKYQNGDVSTGVAYGKNKVSKNTY